MAKTKDEFLGILIKELVGLMKKEKESSERKYKIAAEALMDDSRYGYQSEINQTKRIIELYLGDQYNENKIQELLLDELL
ncbi:hypothetical protein ACQJ0Y_14825 [Peribacillus simplex]|uniref:hypothetical protein n=1 Tax=Peribacillus simplex TaxID=1478 RepID=UPI003CE816BB